MPAHRKSPPKDSTTNLGFEYRSCGIWLGTLIDRVNRKLTDDDLQKIVSTYHAWRGDFSTDHCSLGTDHSGVGYTDVPGFCFSATTEQIEPHGYVLTPGRYVGAELHAQFAESAKLESAIRQNLKGLGYAF